MPAIDRRLIQNFEWPLLALTLALLAVGVINLVSAAPDGGAGGIPPTAWRQMIRVGFGLVVMLIVLIPDYRSLERAALPLYAVSVALLVAVLLFAPTINGSQRWLPLGPFQIQASELAKLAIVILFARLLSRRNPMQNLGLPDLVLPALLIAVPAWLILREPDLGTALVLAIVAGSFLFIARVRWSLIASLAASAAVAAGLAWSFYLHDYQKERVLTFLDPDRDRLGSAYHQIQSQIAIGSGGLFGKGYLQGPQSQLDFLPEQQTDFVFSVLAEEWGFVGAGLVLLLYLALLVRGLMIAHASKDQFGSYLAYGVVALLFWPGLINVGMVLGVLPVVGVPLPMLSYGGSALLTSLAALGLLMNVSMRRYVF